jgi:hypothetical protein
MEVKQGIIKSVVGQGEEHPTYGKDYLITFEDGFTVIKKFKEAPRVSAGQKWHVKYEVKTGTYAGNYVKEVIEDGATAGAAVGKPKSDWKPNTLDAAIKIAQIALNNASVLYGVPGIERVDKDGNVIDYSEAILNDYNVYLAKLTEDVKRLTTEL